MHVIILRTHNGSETVQMCGHISSHTHVILGIDIGLGSDELDDTVGVPIISSQYQWRGIILRTHNGSERTVQMCGHSSSHTHLSFGIGIGIGSDELDDTVGVTIISSHNQWRVITLRTHNGSETVQMCGHTSSHTHLILDIDICIGSDELDDTVGVSIKSSQIQWRSITLRTHNCSETVQMCGHTLSR